MAREKKPASGSIEPQQEELTVVVMKYRGGSASLQKGFDAVSQAIAALGPAPSGNHRVIVHKTAAQLPTAEDIIDAETEDLVEDPTPNDATTETPGDGKPKKVPGERKGYTFDNDFNLAPDKVPSWKDYATGRNPQTEIDKFLTSGAWMQTHGGLTTFTGRHLFTCFRAMEWKTQADMAQPLRVMKNRKSYYENPEQGQWRLTGPGLAAAEKVGTE
jgi:hypothetical protein